MIQEKNIVMCLILSLVTCGLYTLYWFITLSEDSQVLSGQDGVNPYLSLLLIFATCGLYYLYWYYKLGECMDSVCADHGEPNQNFALIFLVCGIFGVGIAAYCLAQNKINQFA